MGQIKFKKIRAMSLLSLLIVLTMVVVVMAASAPIISRNLIKISKGKKNAGEASLNSANGYFICYYKPVNENGNIVDQLCYKQVEADANGNIQTITPETCDRNNQCEFIVPDANLFEFMLVGGGGGGEASSVKNNFDSEVASETIMLNETTVISSNLFGDFRDYVERKQVREALKFLFNNVIVALKGTTTVMGTTSSNTCTKEYANQNQFQFNDSNNDTLELKFTSMSYSDNLNEYTDRTFYLNGVEQFAYNGAECIAPLDPGNCGCGNNNTGELDSLTAAYGIKRLTAGGYRDLITNENPLNFKLISYAVETKEGTKGGAGEVKKYKASFLGDSDRILISKNSLGKGGNGGIIDVTNNTSTPAQSGSKTEITINGVVMVANGGSAGTKSSNTYRLSEIKDAGRGESGDKPKFYIPSQLGINESDLVVGVGSTCTQDGCDEIKNSKFPGSSGASSGYNIGRRNIDIGKLKGNKMARVEVLVNGSKLPVHPIDYDYTNGTPNRPDMEPKMQNGGSGANGAILITW